MLGAVHTHIHESTKADWELMSPTTQCHPQLPHQGKIFLTGWGVGAFGSCKLEPVSGTFLSLEARWHWLIHLKMSHVTFWPHWPPALAICQQQKWSLWKPAHTTRQQEPTHCQRPSVVVSSAEVDDYVLHHVHLHAHHFWSDPRGAHLKMEGWGRNRTHPQVQSRSMRKGV